MIVPRPGNRQGFARHCSSSLLIVLVVVATSSPGATRASRGVGGLGEREGLRLGGYLTVRRLVLTTANNPRRSDDGCR